MQPAIMYRFCVSSGPGKKRLTRISTSSQRDLFEYIDNHIGYDLQMGNRFIANPMYIRHAHDYDKEGLVKAVYPVGKIIDDQYKKESSLFVEIY